MPKIDVSTNPNYEEQLAHTVESMLKDEPENNEVLLPVVVLPVFFLLVTLIVSWIEEERSR